LTFYGLNSVIAHKAEILKFETLLSYLHRKLHMPSSNAALILPTNGKPNVNFGEASQLFIPKTVL
jgi:hypothetical protein